MQKPKVSKNFIYIGTALVLAVLASVVAVRYVQQQVADRTRDDRAMTQIAVPASDLPQGTVITESDLQLRRIPSDLVPADAVTADNFGEYAGRMLRAPVRGGAPLSAAALVPLYDQFSRVIPKGKVAYTLSVDENNSISGMIAPGDLIDILLMMDGDTGEEGGPGAQVFPLLDQIKVLATGSRVGERITPDGQVAPTVDGFSSVTLELDRYQANQLAIASKAGTLRVLLRELNDGSPGSPNGLNENALLRSLGSGSNGIDPDGGIEFIIGGRG
ncbi:MAG TPA: Flp pilus assembly protein CpaB [Luteimonas sp.]|nr:Flp pilus assembly protein CpaB [Luteimonas sp.]